MSELDQLMDQMIREYQKRPEALAMPPVANEYLMTLVSCGEQHAIVAKNENATWRVYNPNTNALLIETVDSWVGAMDQARKWVRQREYLAAIGTFCRDFEPPAVL